MRSAEKLIVYVTIFLHGQLCPKWEIMGNTLNNVLNSLNLICSNLPKE